MDNVLRLETLEYHLRCLKNIKQGLDLIISNEHGLDEVSKGIIGKVANIATEIDKLESLIDVYSTGILNTLSLQDEIDSGNYKVDSEKIFNGILNKNPNLTEEME